LSRSDCQKAFEKKDLSLLIRELYTPEVITVTQNDPLFLASRKISLGDFAALPVVDSAESAKLVGVINHRDITAAFSGIMVKQKVSF